MNGESRFYDARIPWFILIAVGALIAAIGWSAWGVSPETAVAAINTDPLADSAGAASGPGQAQALPSDGSVVSGSGHLTYRANAEADVFAAEANAQSLRATWRRSAGPEQGMVINEVMPNPAEPGYAWVELFNPLRPWHTFMPLILQGMAGSTASPLASASASSDPFSIPLAGWQLTDQDEHVYTIPADLPPVPPGVLWSSTSTGGAQAPTITIWETVLRSFTRRQTYKTSLNRKEIRSRCTRPVSGRPSPSWTSWHGKLTQARMLSMPFKLTCGCQRHGSAWTTLLV